MTAAAPSAPNMRPNHCWSLLQVSVMAVLLLNSTAEGEETECETVISVRRDTVHKVFAGRNLRLECPVTFCNDTKPNFSWSKLEKTDIPVNESKGHIKIEWNVSSKTEAMLLLIFQNIHANDSGTYQCRSGSEISHYINVSVNDTGGDFTNVTPENNHTGSTSQNNNDLGDAMLYVYSGAGIAAIVIIVIVISVVSMQGCKGKIKTERPVDNTYMAVPMMEQPHASPSPRGSPTLYSVPRRSMRKVAASQSDAQPPPRDHTQPEDGTRGGRGHQRDVAKEDEGSLVYAALNHQPPARGAARPRRPAEETSEYAAIRVSGL